MNADLKGKCALITGASGGIGQTTAQAFADEGAGLALHYHRNRQGIDEMLDRLDVKTESVQADLTVEHQAEAMFDKALATFPKIDILVVNAATWNPTPVPLHQMTASQWQQTIEADLTSAFYTCRAFMRHLADSPRQSASIVLVGSTAAIFGEADHADYAAAKAGLVYGLTRSLKNEIVHLAPKGRVNCVCPGWTDTPMAASQIADANLVQQATATRPLRVIARPEDVASAILFLASDTLAAHISGAILPVAGGMEGRLLHP